MFRRRCPLGTVEQSMCWTARTAEVPLRLLVAVPVDVGKTTAMLMACDFTGRVLVPAVEFAMTRDGLTTVLTRLSSAHGVDPVELGAAGRCAAGAGRGGGGRSLSPPVDRSGGVADRLAGCGGEPGARQRAAAGQ